MDDPRALISGEQIEDSEPIRDFLRSGPDYPEVVPTSSTTVPEYPISGG